MAKETSVKETTPAVSPPETKASPPTSLFGKFYPTDPHYFKTVHSRHPPPPPHLFLTGNFSNDDCDGSEDVKKVIGLISKSTTLRVSTLFCTLFYRH